MVIVVRVGDVEILVRERDFTHECVSVACLPSKRKLVSLAAVAATEKNVPPLDSTEVLRLSCVVSEEELTEFELLSKNL